MPGRLRLIFSKEFKLKNGSSDLNASSRREEEGGRRGEIGLPGENDGTYGIPMNNLSEKWVFPKMLSNLTKRGMHKNLGGEESKFKKDRRLKGN